NSAWRWTVGLALRRGRTGRAYGDDPSPASTWPRSYGRAPGTCRGRGVSARSRLCRSVADDEWHCRTVSEVAVPSQPWWRGVALDIAAVAACENDRTALGEPVF